MAINVNSVYRTVLTILNKEERGTLTPDAYNRLARQAQIELLDKAFYDYNRAILKINAGGAVDEYGDIEEKITDKIDPFYKASDITLTNGLGTLPTDIYKIIKITITNKTIELERINKHKLSYLLSSPLTKPSASFPVYYVRANPSAVQDIIVEPAFTDQSWTLGDLNIEYIKKPTAPIWAFTTESVSNVNTKRHDATNSVNFELHPTDEPDLVTKILSYLGVILKDPALLQAASQKMQNDFIKEQ